ncbi:hypothetical protein [Ruegeria sp. R14_0]|uniref:hypothetical protein n=1 Tax=Ruegeria sp. R14_0 TaxID=2821100 RepID=UPI001ADAD291|nr:hypothetical protein [Ruegeria sp. R14_0]MBO9444695.1 hypothetical protein [Ruegeria sp. R14_0]
MTRDQLSRAERKLAAQITLLLYRRVASQLSSISGPDPEFRYAGPEGGDLLVKIGLCERGEQPYEYVLVVDESAVIKMVETRKGLTSKDLNTLLNFFFQFFIAHGRIGCLSSTRELFSPGAKQETLAQSLIENGYLSRHGQQVQWTDYASKQMEANGHWEGGVSHYDERTTADNLRFSKIYSEMPESLIKILAEAAQTHGNWKVIELLPRYYWNGKWLAEPMSKYEAGKFGQLGLVVMGRLVNRLKSEHGF